MDMDSHRLNRAKRALKALMATYTRHLEDS